jgi:hypothetical protein
MCRFPDAVQRVCGAPLIRDRARRRLERDPRSAAPRFVLRCARETRNHRRSAGLVGGVSSDTETTMRVIILASLLTAALGSSAFAQKTGDYRHHTFCLKTGSGQECAYDSFAQCEAAKRGGADSCVANSAPQDH